MNNKIAFVLAILVIPPLVYAAKVIKFPRRISADKQMEVKTRTVKQLDRTKTSSKKP